MADIEIRTIGRDEVREYVRCVYTAFFVGKPVDDDSEAFWAERMKELDRRHAGYADGVLAGTAGAFSTEVTVPGGRTVPLAAVTGVTVLPTHRRRGLLTGMMQAQLQDCIERGETAAMLIAAEWPIYGRFGYGMAVEACTTRLDATTARFRPADDDGSFELVFPALLRELAPRVFDAHRRSVAGPIGRDAMTWDFHVGLRTRPMDTPRHGIQAVVHRSPAGVVDGYAIYRAGDESWVDNRPAMSIRVDELLTTNDDAYRALWRYLAEIDWVVEVKASVRPVDEPLRLLLVDGRAAVQRDRSDHMWLRLLDLPSALTGRSYESPVNAVVEVVDDLLGRGGRWRLDAGPGGAELTPTTESADVTVAIDALSGAYLGGTPLWWFADRVEEHTTGAAAALDTALRTRRAPWCTSSF